MPAFARSGKVFFHLFCSCEEKWKVADLMHRGVSEALRDGLTFGAMVIFCECE